MEEQLVKAGLHDADVSQLAAKERFLHQPAAAVEVIFHAGSRSCRVAALDRVDNGEVRFGCTLLKRTEVHAERHEPIDFRKTSIDQLHRQRVARGRRDGEMEPDVCGFRVAILDRRVAPSVTRIAGIVCGSDARWRSLDDLIAVARSAAHAAAAPSSTRRTSNVS